MPDRYYQFLGVCLRGDGERLCEFIREPGWDWEEFCRTASDEALLPALKAHFAQLKINTELPLEIAGFLSAVERVNRERNGAILSEVKHAVTLLNGVGVRPILLKGVAYLAAGVYRDAAARYIGDIDLLVPESQIPAAVEELSRNHYQQDNRDPFGPFRHHYPPLHRAGRPQIELHHSLGPGKCSRLLAAPEVIAKSLSCDLDGTSVGIPCPEHLATHLIMHSQIQHPYTERIWPPLRAICDLLYLDRRYGADLNWKDIQARFRRAGENGTLVLHLRQVSSTVGVAPPLAIDRTVLTGIRWSRRKVLRRLPFLRYIDPVYMFSTVLSRRILMLRNLVGSRKGWRYLSARVVERQLYLRLWTDLLEGRGR